MSTDLLCPQELRGNTQAFFHQDSSLLKQIELKQITILKLIGYTEHVQY